MNKKLEAYFQGLGLHPACYDLEREVKLLREACEAGLRGDAEALEMIPTYVGSKLLEERRQETVLVLDAGGTNLRVSVVRIGPEGEELLEWRKQPLPGTQGSLPAEAFFACLAELVQPLLHYSRRLAFCFSFSADILPDREARVRLMSKEVSVTGMAGRLLGEELRKALRDRGDSGELEVLVLNDTIAALLSALPETQARGLEGPLGLIHGTGINSAYAEAKEYPKFGGKLLCPMLINTESGNYSMQNRGPVDLYLDRHSTLPDDHEFEKLFSGAYLGEIARLGFLAATGKLVADGCPAPETQLFSEGFAEKFESRYGKAMSFGNAIISLWRADAGSAEVAEFEACLETEADREAASVLFDLLYERAAQLLLIQITALLEQAGIGRDADHPAAVLIEGTTFHRSTGLAEKLYHRLEKLAKEKGLHTCILACRENSNLFGSALAWQTKLPVEA